MQDRHRSTLRRTLLAAATALAFTTAFAFTTASAQQTVLHESEPNDDPPSANRIVAADRIIGELPVGDQDAFLWSVSDVDALKPWTLTFQGVPGALTIAQLIRLEFAEDGITAIRRTNLFTLGSRDGSRPVSARDVLLEPGDYLIGIARAGRGSGYRPPAGAAAFLEGNRSEQEGSDREQDDTTNGYRLSLEGGRPLPDGSRGRSNDTRKQAFTLRAGKALSAQARSKSSWFELVIGKADAEFRWDLIARVPVGRTARLHLLSPDGKAIAEARADEQGAIHLPELAFDTGKYLLRLDGEPDTLYTLALQQGGQRVDGQESEPNDTWQLANRIKVNDPVSGSIQRERDADHFTFELTEQDADTRLAIDIEADSQGDFTACLLDHRGRDLQCTTGDSDRTMAGLALAPGSYGVRIGRGPPGVTYQFRLRDDGPHEPGTEAEPNDSIALATSLPVRQRIKGTLHRGDEDFIRLDLSGAPRMWRFQVNGSGLHELSYHDGSGKTQQTIRAAVGQRRILLDDLFLLPGTHYLSIHGRETGAYTLIARDLGTPAPGREIEPNDDATRSQRIDLDEPRTGLLAEPADRDNYRFHLANHDRIRLSVQAPPDGAIRALLHWNGQPMREWNDGNLGKIMVLEGVFPPGDYRLELSPTKPSDDRYTLEFTRLERYGCPIDCEPNDNIAFARPLPVDATLAGQVGEWRDEDWYALPVFETDTRLTIAGDRSTRVALLSHEHDRNALNWDADAGAFKATLAAGEQRYLQIRGKGAYRLDIHRGEPRASAPSPEPGPGPTLPVTLRSVLPQTEFAAYQPFSQHLTGRIELVNNDNRPVSLALDAVTSDRRWKLDIAPRTVALPAGGTVDARLDLTVPADAWADRPVRISLRARAEDGSFVQTATELTARHDVGLVSPGTPDVVPQALRGGFNLAWKALGGRWLGAEDSRLGQGLGDLFDGRAVRGEGLVLRGTRQPAPYETTVELAGSGEVEIAGLILDPLGRSNASGQLRRFALALSSDGETYTPVLAAALEPVPNEQYFELERPIKARFARLTLIDDFTGNAGGPRGLGEWKVIARPGQAPFGDRPLNLADPRLGGHVVVATPPVSPRWDDALLDTGTAATRFRVAAGERPEWVIGFHHNRAAMITGIEWVREPTDAEDGSIDRIDVAVSRDSPLGPWDRVASATLDTGASTRIAFDSPVWARFVRLSLPAESKRRVLLAPSAIRVFERPAGPEYLSILGEWGFNDHRAAYEHAHPPEPPVPFEQAAHDTRERAATLKPGDFVQGRVMLGKHEHWYRTRVQPGHNTLELALSGEPTLRTRLRLENAHGEAIVLRPVELKTGFHRYEASVEESEVVYVRVDEPPRNVVFAWDTSASVGAYLPVIYSALNRYASGLVPGRDAANLMPFGSALLLEDWHGDPYLLQKILNEYPRKESSSAAESTLARASQALADRAGTKAIVLITDAATNRDTRVWEQFRETRPRVIALGLDSHGAFGRNPDREQDLLQDWSSVAGGHYTHLLSEAEMEIAFDRATSLLREPAPYRLELATSLRKPASPGRLQVLGAPASGRPKQGGTDSGAVALILDASGSMLKRLDGERRIDIARRVLGEVVTEVLAPGTPVALRVFGHRQPNACRTDLELPLAPLDPKKAARAIAGIEARNLARTPIADSLAKVPSDLRRHEGSSTIVLVTDGEETCDGDPEAVIRELVEQGFELRLNIVGFALDDAPLEHRFEAWARLGGGRYFSASDSDEFRRALTDALRRPYLVFDANDEEVARGVVDGEPIELAAGQYQVRILSSGDRQSSSVTVSAGRVETLRLD